MKRTIIFSIYLLCVLICHIEARTLVSNQRWVESKQREFDSRTYLTDHGSGSSEIEARDRAIQNLAERMIADVTTTRVTTRSVNERSEIQSGSRTDMVLRTQTHDGETNINTDVKLIGVEIQTSPVQDDGLYYAFVYINRKQGAERYRDMINNNITSIISIIDDTRGNLGQLFAIQRFREATALAYETDMLYVIQGVLEPTETINRPVYGDFRNPTEIRIASEELSRNFAIRVNVKDDINNRIRTAMISELNKIGLNAISQGNALYFLDVELILEESVANNNDYVFYRYVLNYSLRNNQGQIVFTGQDTGREGAASTTGAKETTLRSAVKTISEKGFIEKFKAFIEK
jgi:hypothetical protein